MILIEQQLKKLQEANIDHELLETQLKRCKCGAFQALVSAVIVGHKVIVQARCTADRKDCKLSKRLRVYRMEPTKSLSNRFLTKADADAAAVDFEIEQTAERAAEAAAGII